MCDSSPHAHGDGDASPPHHGEKCVRDAAFLQRCCWLSSRNKAQKGYSFILGYYLDAGIEVDFMHGIEMLP
jgi:hypothetical protein